MPEWIIQGKKQPYDSDKKKNQSGLPAIPEYGKSAANKQDRHTEQTDTKDDQNHGADPVSGSQGTPVFYMLFRRSPWRIDFKQL